MTTMDPCFNIALSQIRDDFTQKGLCGEKDYQEYLINLWNLCQTTEDSVMNFTALIANELHSAHVIIESGEREIYRLIEEKKDKQEEIDELWCDYAALEQEKDSAKQLIRLLCCLIEKEIKEINKNDE